MASKIFVLLLLAHAITHCKPASESSVKNSESSANNSQKKRQLLTQDKIFESWGSFECQGALDDNYVELGHDSTKDPFDTDHLQNQPKYTVKVKGKYGLVTDPTLDGYVTSVDIEVHSNEANPSEKNKRFPIKRTLKFDPNIKGFKDEDFVIVMRARVKGGITALVSAKTHITGKYTASRPIRPCYLTGGAGIEADGQHGMLLTDKAKQYDRYICLSKPQPNGYQYRIDFVTKKNKDSLESADDIRPQITVINKTGRFGPYKLNSLRDWKTAWFKKTWYRLPAFPTVRFTVKDIKIDKVIFSHVPSAKGEKEDKRFDFKEQCCRMAATNEADTKIKEILRLEEDAPKGFVILEKSLCSEGM